MENEASKLASAVHSDIESSRDTKASPVTHHNRRGHVENPGNVELAASHVTLTAAPQLNSHVPIARSTSFARHTPPPRRRSVCGRRTEKDISLIGCAVT